MGVTNTIFMAVACVAFSVGSAEIRGREIRIATRSTAITIDGDFSDWSRFKGSFSDEDGFRLKTAWDEKHVYLMVQADGGADFWGTHADDYFNFGIDLKNDGDFSYEPDDFHFVLSVPNEGDQVSASLIRTGAASVEVSELIQVAGKRAARGYRWELALSVDQLGGEKLEAERSLGFQFERRGANAGPAPFLMPVLWGDLGLADEEEVLSPEAARRIANQQAEMAERYRRHQKDPEKPERIDQDARRDLERLTKRFIELQVEDVAEQAVDQWLESQLPSGQWPEFEYGPTDEVNVTSRMYHLYRLRKLAYAREKLPLGKAKKERILEAIFRGMDYTIEENLYFRNWFYNEIGYPLEFARIALYLRNELKGERRAEIIRVLKRSKRPMTGQNFIWINKVTLIRGLLQENPALVQRSIERIAEMVRVEEGEGLQADFSFHQHGSQLYSHGYGAKFVSDLTEVIYMAHGGRFQFPEAKRELILGMLLDGGRWMARGTFADFAALGRLISVADKDASYLAPVAELWLRMEDGREEELQQLMASASGQGADQLQGNRYFYRSEFMVHRRKGFYASVKAYSKLLTGTESINGQGLKNYYLPDGATLFVREGDEYAEIQPVWDWRRIPGVTGIVSEDPIPLLDHRVVRTKGNTDFVGGASDGWRGAAVYDYQRDGVAALKSYFGFDWGMVMLGANIRSEREEPLQTAVEQSLANGDARIACKGGLESEAVLGEIEFEKSPEAIGVWHDGALYYLPAGQSFSIASKSQVGAWRELQRTGKTEEIERRVFSITLQHGAKPRSESYEYAVIDVEIESDVIGSLQSVPYRVLANGSEVQAVSDAAGRHCQLIFHEAGRCELLGGALVSVSKRCVLLVSLADDGEYILTASDPSRVGGTLIVELRNADGEKGEAVFHLPRSSLSGGESTSMRIKIGK